MLTMDEKDAEDRRMDEQGYQSGCLTSILMFIAIPVALILGFNILL